ncbi:type II toxin-antitoxin system RelB/DinJ family antitoxin [Pectinatus frisingensis]|uniref:type II toxin-antitoxin system RelB/DinJ family antitoxin n=1 Tax=Pectinatus frisingensis TaxID=865 RepID=UPI0018C81961|nr:type II toxin-antitoxin system RelB/DinJ family antitoxin [Pectinatus frisingensis]
MDDKQLKNKYIHVRIEENFKNDITALAKKYGMNISDLINVLLHQWYVDKTK